MHFDFEQDCFPGSFMWITEFVGSPLNSAPKGSAHLPHPSPGPKGFSHGLTCNFALSVASLGLTPLTLMLPEGTVGAAGQTLSATASHWAHPSCGGEYWDIETPRCQGVLYSVEV